MANIFREALLTPRQQVKQPAPDVFQNLLLTTLAIAAVVIPFHQTDWPNPSRIVQKPQFDSPNLTIRLPVAPPFKQLDWPNPKPLVRPLVIDAPNLTAGFPVSPPFKQIDWPNPRSVVQPLVFNAPNLVIQSVVVTAAPFSQTDWPVPKVEVRIGQFDTPNLLGTTLAPTVAAKPFTQVDWSVPRSVQRTQQNDYQNLLVTTLVPTGPMPFSQTNWPNPPYVRQGDLTIAQVSFNLPPTPVPPVVAGSSRYWKARRSIDWNAPFSFADQIKPEIQVIEQQVKEQKVYKQQLYEYKTETADFTSIEKEIVLVEAKIKALLEKKDEYYTEYFEFVKKYRADKAHQRELKKAYLVAFKADEEEKEFMELLDLGVI